MPYPTGTETDDDIPFAGQLFDRGGMCLNVMHPDFGAVGNGVADDGVAWNLAVAALSSAGGLIVVPPGTYLLTTAFSFSGNTNVTLLILPGVTLTGSALPTPSGTNAIINWSSGYFVFNGAFGFGSVETGIVASTVQAQGQRPLTKTVNIITTCANDNDCVTLPPAFPGRVCFVKNYDTVSTPATLLVYAAVGDEVDKSSATLIDTGYGVVFIAIDNTDWYVFSRGVP